MKKLIPIPLLVVALRLCGVPWLWALSPLWVPLAAFLLVLLLELVAMIRYHHYVPITFSR